MQRKQKNARFFGIDPFFIVYGAIYLFVILGIAFWVCIAQSWTTAAWIIGVPFGIVSLYLLVGLVIFILSNLFD